MVSRNTTLVPSLGLRIGPACETGLSAGMRRERVTACVTPNKKERKRKIWRKTIFNMADEIITPCNAAWAWHWIRQMAAPCNVAGGSGMICYMEFAQTSAVLEFYIWFRLWPYHPSRHVILHQSAKFYPNRTTLSRKNDVMSILNMVDLRHLGF